MNVRLWVSIASEPPGCLRPIAAIAYVASGGQTTPMDDPDYELRCAPDSDRLLEEARLNPGGWVYEIDFEYGDDEAVPPEAIRGAWEVSTAGALTGRCRSNDRHRAIVECNRTLAAYMHAAAKSNPGKWICEIAPRGEHLFPKIPDEMIRGWWLIGSDGNITQSFRPNAAYESG